LKPPYFDVTAICRNASCKNGGKEFIKQKKTITYQATDGSEKKITDVVCPFCRSWGRVVKTQPIPR
jgi:hypothetical protein